MREKFIVRQYIYPAILNPPPYPSQTSSHRTTGSTTAAIITILHTVAHLLVTNPYVILIARDFSKAFDIVKHKTFLEKMAELDISDQYTTE